MGADSLSVSSDIPRLPPFVVSELGGSYKRPVTHAVDQRRLHGLNVSKTRRSTTPTPHFHPHLLHDMGAMQLDILFSGAEVGGDLFVELASDNVRAAERLGIGIAALERGFRRMNQAF